MQLLREQSTRFFLHQEFAELKKQLAEVLVSLAFDGQTRVHECLCVVARFVHVDEWSIRHVILDLHTFKESVNGERIGEELRKTVDNRLLTSDTVVGIMRDGAAVNGVAYNKLAGLCHYAANLTCLSHFLNNLSLRLCLPAGELLVSIVANMTRRSLNGQMAFESAFGRRFAGYNPTRWGMTQELMRELFTDIEQALPSLTVEVEKIRAFAEHDHVKPDRRKALLDLLSTTVPPISALPVAGPVWL